MFVLLPLEAPWVSIGWYPAGITTVEYQVRDEVRVLSGGGPWFGVTYPDDAPVVRRSIQKLVESGEYPSPLWEDAA